jgi:hypothetical protein
VYLGGCGGSNSRSYYRYDFRERQYIYNLDTRWLEPGHSYLVRTTLDDRSTHDVVISIRSSRGGDHCDDPR